MEAEFITPAEAVELIKIMQVQGLDIRRENLHFYETDTSQTLICLNSIVNSGNNFQIN